MALNINLENESEDQLGYWYSNLPKMRKFRKVSTSKMRELGLKTEDIKMVDDFDGLRSSPPNIIVAEARSNVSFVQNFFKEQTLKKGQKYVMGLGVYQQLHRPQTGKKAFLRPAKPEFSKVYRPYSGQPLNGKSILISRTGGIGDLLFIQPNLLYLKEKYPDCYIRFACGPQYQAMIENWDCIDELLDLPYSLSKLIRTDYHILFEGVIERCKLSHTQNAYNLFSKWIGLDLDDKLLIPTQEPKWDMVDEVTDVLDDWELAEKDFIVMQLRASSPIRTPRPEFFAELICKLVNKGHNIVLTDTTKQAGQIDEFIDQYLDCDKTKVYNFAHKSKSLDYTIALAYLSKCIVATDSALNHIAASMKIPCYGIYGPFPGFIRLKTYPKAKWVDGNLPCSPCFLHGHDPCPKAGADGASPCYDQIDKDKAIKEIEELIDND
jgi:ADP-heptose:LPS heptosyltransferase